MRSDCALPKNFADQNDNHECNIPEASDNELWEDVITAEDGVITVSYAVYTLQQSVHDFFKANFSGKEVVSKVRNVAKKSSKQNSREFFEHNNKLFSRVDSEICWGSTFLVFESMLFFMDLQGQFALANEFFLLSDLDWFAVQELTECLNHSLRHDHCSAADKTNCR